MSISIPTVSVLMATYNDYSTIDEAIKSILNQTFKDFEFIIVDDGSTDGSTDIVEYWSKQDDRIRVITQKNNTGLTMALNNGLNVARGKYIARQDADDISLPERLSIQLRPLKENKKLVLVASDFECILDDGEYLTTIRNSQKRNIKKKLLKQNEIVHGTAVFPRLIGDVQVMYDPLFKRAQDYDLWLRLTESGDVVILPNVLYKFRYRKEGITAKNTVFSKESCAIRALENRKLRDLGRTENRRPIVNKDVTKQTNIKLQAGNYDLNCAIRCMSGYDSINARKYSYKSLKLMRNDYRGKIQAVKIIVISWLPVSLLRLVRQI